MKKKQFLILMTLIFNMFGCEQPKKVIKEPSIEDLFTEVKDGSNTTLYDEKTKNYVESKLLSPTQKDLTELLSQTKKIIISKLVREDGTDVLVPKEIIRIDKVNDINIAKEKFNIYDNSEGHLMVIGWYFFDFVNQKGEIERIEYLDFGALRWEKSWKDDAALKDPKSFLGWLAGMGINEPLNNWNKYVKENTKKK